MVILFYICVCNSAIGLGVDFGSCMLIHPNASIVHASGTGKLQANSPTISLRLT